jgi:hypothetical protein
MNKTQNTTPETVTGSGVCKCGTCGEIVGSMGKSLYRPGHDARHAGNIARYVAETGDDTKINDLPTDALRNKAENMVTRLRAKAQVKADRDAAKANKTAKWTEGEPVKVGRWTYPTRTNGKTTQRNENRDGSGSWIAL